MTLAGRSIRHVPASSRLKAFDDYRQVPICISCWLASLTEPDELSRLLFRRGFRQDTPVDRASPVSEHWQLYGEKLLRLRREGCGRPIRVNWRGRYRLPLDRRCCCKACLRQ